MESFTAVKTELKTASAPIGESLSKSSPILLDSYDLDICYNQYLSHYQLPLLREPQTISSFRQHLTLNNAKHLECYHLITVIYYPITTFFLYYMIHPTFL